jgi:transcriptional regulator with XRE-family HTH domain
MAARKKRAAGKKKTGGKKKVARKKKGARRKKQAARTSRTTGVARTRRRAAEPSGSWASALTERLTEMVEHAATGALRRVLDQGGREIGEWLPEASQMRIEAGASIRELRELAGLTVEELADAIDLRDRTILEAVEAGTATISFELILRLAAILARHDPAPFVARLVRSYNPVLRQLLEDWGVGRLPIQSVREREFVNVLRSVDEARALPDEDFERVLDFTRSAFETAIHFAAKSAEDSGDG